MKRHTKIYLDAFGYKAERFEDLFIPCEWGCGRGAVDINHIDPRGMGGDPTGKKDTIKNLCAMCRICHNKFEMKQISRVDLLEKHLIICERNGII